MHVNIYMKIILKKTINLSIYLVLQHYCTWMAYSSMASPLILKLTSNQPAACTTFFPYHLESIPHRIGLGFGSFKPSWAQPVWAFNRWLAIAPIGRLQQVEVWLSFGLDCFLGSRMVHPVQRSNHGSSVQHRFNMKTVPWGKPVRLEQFNIGLIWKWFPRVNWTWEMADNGSVRFSKHWLRVSYTSLQKKWRKMSHGWP